VEVSGKKLSFFVDAVEVGSANAAEVECEEFLFVIDDGKAEVTSVSVRKK
jgi:hypothetical protein